MQEVEEMKGKEGNGRLVEKDILFPDFHYVLSPHLKKN